MISARLTVAMSVYNNAPYLAEAIQSILDQSYADFEFLIINDGSTDGSGPLIDSFALRDRRIRVIHQENRGFVSSLNRSFEECRTEWIARMDGDDVSMPERLAKQMAFVAERPDIGVLSCAAVLIGPDGKPLGKDGGQKPLTHAGIHANLEDGPLINHNAALIRRGPVLALGGYRAAFRHCEDYDLWLRLVDRVQLANLPQALIAYRIYPEQVSHRHLVEQTANAAIAWQARLERLAGRPDPTLGLAAMPTLGQLDALFGRAGVAAYVRARVVNRMLFEPAAMSGDGFGILLDYIGETGAEKRTWRAAARILRSGHPAKAASVAHALIQSGRRAG